MKPDSERNYIDEAQTIINDATSRREGHGMADLIPPCLHGIRAELARANGLPDNQIWTPKAVDQQNSAEVATVAVDQQTYLQQAQANEGSRSKYETFIDGLNLSEPETAKLKEMMSEENYVEAVETAKEMKASKIPTYEQIVEQLMTFSPEKLKDICEEMEKPELVIESDQSFDDNISAMNANKYYTSADGKPQNDAFVNSESNSPYRNLDKPGKVKVSIVDGVVHPEQLEGVSTKLGKRRDYLTKKFEAKGMKHISPKGMGALLQKSLRKAKAKNDNSLIVDNWEKWVSNNERGTVTFIDPNELTKSTLVAFASFDSDSRQACFVVYDPAGEAGSARGRASVQVLEI
ncbi:MAG: hypothetical protein PHP74_03615 [Candidatus Gracilibacteria bacterium]|nr:hypothetical protein [Candidatus Gracilibacteria bacterium]